MSRGLDIPRPLRSPLPGKGYPEPNDIKIDNWFPGGGYQILAIDLEGTEVCVTG
jgi:hypothetical protein